MSKTSRNNPNANQYTDEERREAVAIMTELGGLTYESIMTIQAIPKFKEVNRSTLGRWQKELKSEIAPMATEIIERSSDASVAVGNMQDRRLRAYNLLLERMNDEEFVSKQTNLNHIATAWAILEERMRLSIGLTTEIISLCKRFVAVVTRKGYDPATTFEDMIQSFEEEPDKGK